MLDLLARQNPWWLDPAAVAGDHHIRQLADSPFAWRPAITGAMTMDQEAVFIVRGPRQVGKSTLLKTRIQALLSEGVRPRDICYLDCERAGIRSAQELSEAIEAFTRWKGEGVAPAGHEEDRTRHLLLDEVTYVPDWARGVKIASDSGRLREVCLVVTGSDALDLKAGGERLPGRRGRVDAPDLTMLPMSFREFAVIMDGRLEGVPAFSWEPSDWPAVTEAASLTPDTVSDLFAQFLVSGGLPAAVRERINTGRVPEYVFRQFVDVFLGQVARMGRRESVLRDLVAWLANRRENPFDWASASRETGAGKQDTIRDYVEDLEQAFLWRVIHRTRSLGSPYRQPRTPRRLYYLDPLLFHAFHAWSLGYGDSWTTAVQLSDDPARRGYLVETVLSAHLARHADRLLYHRNGGEIDFVLFREGGGRALIESKYQGRVTGADSARLRENGGGVLVSRDTLRYDAEARTLIIPAARLLMMLEERDATRSSSREGRR